MQSFIGSIKRYIILIGSILLTILSLGAYAYYQRRKRDEAELKAKRASIEAERYEVTNEIIEDMRAIDALYATDAHGRVLAKARYNHALGESTAGRGAPDLRTARRAAGLLQS